MGHHHHSKADHNGVKWGQMKPTSFDSTPEFARYRDMMRKLVAVPKAELDELVKTAKDASPRNGNRNAPGRKSVKPRNRSEQ